MQTQFLFFFNLAVLGLRHGVWDLHAACELLLAAYGIEFPKD